MLSLPIPEPSDNDGAGVPYSSLRAGTLLSYLDVIQQLGYRRPDEVRGAHLDPDLVRDALNRPPGWRPMFGQAEAAESHLENEGVDVGDIFMFFGLFRRTERQAGGSLRWVKDSPAVQALFGYLQIGEKVKVDRSTCNRIPWALDHPHLRDVDRRGNTLYLASDDLTSLDASLPGAGSFRWGTHVCLSSGDETASVWTLPSCFGPPDRKRLTYHADPKRWRLKPDGNWRVQAVARGQEFVIDADEELRKWASEVVSKSFFQPHEQP
jgi:hypothetical protein